MKKYIVVSLFLAQVLLTGAAMAMSVDFSVLGPPANDPPLTVDITTASNPAGFTLSGVTFRYDDFGSGVDFSFIDENGLFGTTGGMLALDFSTPATGLTLNFALLDAISSSGDGSQMPDSMVALFFSNGVFQDSTSIAADFLAYDMGIDPTLGLATGLLNYQGRAFDQAVMYLSPDAPFFTVSDVTTATAPVPEPATSVLMATGLIFGLAGWQRHRRKR